jgi:hypothetical protein
MSLKGIKILSLLLLCCFFSSAQKKIGVKYFENDKQLAIENARFFLVTKKDTINLQIIKGKIQVADSMKDNFNLFVELQGRPLKIGSYRPDMFKELDEIIVGHITDFSTFKKSWEFKDTYKFGEGYLLEIPDSNSKQEIIYSLVVRQVNVSLISDFKQYIPVFTNTYEVL